MTRKNRQPKKMTSDAARNQTLLRRNTMVPSRLPKMRGVTPLPRNFPVFADCLPMRLRGTLSIPNSVSSSNPVTTVAIAPIFIGAIDYYGLSNIFSITGSMGTNYSRYCVTRLRVEVTPTTPVTSGGFIAVGYEPDDTNTSGPSQGLRDVTSSEHSAVASMGETCSIELRPSDYFNAWTPCTSTSGSSTIVSQCGVVQFYGANAAGPSTNTGSPVVYTPTYVAIATFEIDIWYAGYRSTT